MIASVKRLLHWLFQQQRGKPVAEAPATRGRRCPPTCPICRGGGQVVVGIATGPGKYTYAVRGCFVCGGAGTMPVVSLKRTQGHPERWHDYRMAWATN